MENIRSNIYNFMYNCDKNNLIKYLCENQINTDIKFTKEESFQIILQTCEKNNSSILQLLLNFSDFDINQEDNYIFKHACENGADQIVKLIYSLGGVDLAKLSNCIEDLFCKICYSNNINLLYWFVDIYKPNKIDYHFNDDILFRTCCQKNLIDVILVLTTLSNFNPSIDKKFNDKYTHEHTFHYFCRFGYIELAKAYFSFCSYDVNSLDNEAICLACQEGHLELAKWLYSVGGDILSQNNWCFGISISNDHLDILKWIHSLNLFNIHNQGDYFFRFACTLGRTEIAKWIYSLGGVNYRAYNDYAFVGACSNNHLEVAKWIYSIEEINFLENNGNLFKYVCQRGCLDVAKWLYSLDIIDIHDENETAFRLACMMNNVQLVKWLHSLGDINIRANNNESFARACSYNDVELALWLQSLNPDEYQVTIEYGNIVYWNIVKELVIDGDKDVEEVEDCPICYSNMCDLITGCNHQFCKDCIEKYIDKSSDDYNSIPCPYCKQEQLKFYRIKNNQEK